MEIALDSQTVNVTLSHTQLLISFGVALVALFGAIWAIGLLFLNQINQRFTDQNQRFADQLEQTNQRFADQLEQTNQRFAEQLEQTNQRFAEQREQTNQRFAEQRKYIDQRFNDLRIYMDQRFEAVLSGMGEIKKDVREIRGYLMQPAQTAMGSQATSEARTGAPQPERRESTPPPSPERGSAPAASDRMAAPQQGGGGRRSASAQGLPASDESSRG